MTPYEQIGSTGLVHYGGRVAEELHPRLSGRKAQEAYREMGDNDPVVGAILYAITSVLRQVEWRLEPAVERDADAADVAAFVESCRSDMSHTWQDFVSEVLSCIQYGWSYFETVYKVRRGPDETDGRFRSKYSDGRIGWRKIGIRAQDSLDRWELEKDGGIRGMWQRPRTGGDVVFLPIEKCLLFRPVAPKNNPEGRSLLRNAYRPWHFAKRLEEIEAVSIAQDGTGIPVFTVPPAWMAPDASAEQQAAVTAMKTIVQQFARNERSGAVVPAESYTDTKGQEVKTGVRFSLMASPGTRALDIGSAIQRHRTSIALTLLHQWILLGTQPNGSRSLADTQTAVSALAMGAVLDAVCDVFNRFEIPRLCQLNGIPPELWPKLVHGDLDEADIQRIAQAVTQLVTAGVILPTPQLERKLLEMAGLPQPDESAYGADDFDDDANSGETAPPAPAPRAQAATGEVQHLVDIVERVTQRRIPRSAGVAIIRHAFAVDEATANDMLGDAGIGPAPSDEQTPTDGAPAD